MTLERSPLYSIRGWVFDDARQLIGIVVELPDESWRYRPFSADDRLRLPVPTVKLVATLRRYLAEEAPDGPYPPGA
jgi:hypothetical protein